MVFHHVVPKFFFGNPNKNQQKIHGSPAQWEVENSKLPGAPSCSGWRSAGVLQLAFLDESSWSWKKGFEESNFSNSEAFFFFILIISNTSRFWFSNFFLTLIFWRCFCEKSFPFRVEWIFSIHCHWFDWGAASQLLEDEYRNELRRSGHPRWTWMEVFTGKLPPVFLPSLP